VPDVDDEASLNERRFATADGKNGDFKSPLLEKPSANTDLSS
jgi:hypothetical protein